MCDTFLCLCVHRSGGTVCGPSRTDWVWTPQADAGPTPSAGRLMFLSARWAAPAGEGPVVAGQDVRANV